jgi:predicted lipoprotein
MEQLGTNNMAAYLRKMAIDGYVVKLDLPELREMISLLRRSSNNLNQIAKRVNSTNRLYDTDMEEMLQTQEQLWTAANEILTRLASIR